MTEVKLYEGMFVEVYRNLHNKCWSVRYNGKVIWRTANLNIKNARFIVQPAGNARVRREGRKNVHAFIRGNLTWDPYPENMIWEGRRVTYDPYQHESFVWAFDNCKVSTAQIVMLDINRGVYAIP